MLTRFRANPDKISVSIRHLNNGWWRAKVISKDNKALLSCIGIHKLSSIRAIVLVLKEAEKEKLDGIDLSMGWSYNHYWK